MDKQPVRARARRLDVDCSASIADAGDIWEIPWTRQPRRRSPAALSNIRFPRGLSLGEIVPVAPGVNWVRMRLPMQPGLA
jgi:hypothetical protein